MEYNSKRKSIDGILPTYPRHDVYVEKRRLDAYRKMPIVSIQPRMRQDILPHNIDQTIDRISRSDGPEALDSTTAESDTANEKDNAVGKELVVNVSPSWSVRASISIVVQYILIATVAVIAAYSTSIGQWFVLALAVYVITTRQDSRLTFGIALFVLVSVPFFQIINQTGVAANMAVYVFELMMLGVVQSIIELKWRKGVDMS